MHVCKSYYKWQLTQKKNTLSSTIVLLQVSENHHRNDLGIANKTTDIIKKRQLKCFGHMVCKIISTIHIGTALSIEDPEDNHKNDGVM